jgi:4-amino-4-deoxy-L-arabinose transferase-like glycosyltransferase
VGSYRLLSPITQIPSSIHALSLGITAMSAINKVIIEVSGAVGGTEGHSIDHFRRFSDWLRRHVILASLIIALCAFSTRLFFTLHADPHDLTFPDSPTYLEPAQSLMKSGSFLNKYNIPEISRTPGYPVFLATLMYIVGEELGSLLIAQTVIVSFSVLILYWLARRILPPVMAFTGAILAAFSPWGAVRAGFLLSEGLFLLILVLLFFAMYLVVEHTTKLSAVLLGGSLVGLLTSAAVLVRPVLPLVPLVGAVLFLLYRDKRKTAWLLVATMLLSASIPLYLWKMRNLHEAQFDGLTDISGKAAWVWLAASVNARVKGAEGDRWAMVKVHEAEEYRRGLSLQEADDERWRRAKAVFQEHPFLTVYSFASNAAEPLVHPDPGILIPAALNFHGDLFVLGGIWAASLLLSLLALSYSPDRRHDDGIIDRNWLTALLGICLVLTLISGVAFGAGSRYRAPLELIIPLLAGVGLIRVFRSFQVYP